MDKKVLILCGQSHDVITFRMGLIESLKKKGYKTAVIALDNCYKDDIQSRGIEFYDVGTRNRSLNPFGMIKMKNKYYSLINQIRPDIVFTFMIKPNIFGVQAARKAGVKRIFSTIEGVGDIFINNGFKWKIIRYVACKMYKRAFKKVHKVFFLNEDDKNEFVSRRLVDESKSIIIPGVGVDTEHFAYKPINNNRTFLMIARMLTTKGVKEFFEAAHTVKKLYPDTVFNYIGAEETVKLEEVRDYIDEGSVNYLGVVDDVRSYIEDCSVFVLPSYREGMPMSIMEAESVGRAVITTDVPGCRQAIVDGVNGYLIEKGSEKQIVEKVLFFIEHPDKMVEMSKKSRALAVDKFDKVKVNEYMLYLAGVECCSQ